MKRLYIEKQVERFLRFEDAAYANRAQAVMLERYDSPDDAMRFYGDWLSTSRLLRDHGMQVFVFDPDAQREIGATDGALDEREVYRAFPYDAAYVSVSHEVIDGFAVVKDHEKLSVGFMPLVRRDAHAAYATSPGSKQANVPLADIPVEAMCNLTSYIASVNADLELAYEPPSDARVLANRKKRRSAATVTRVGWRIGSAIREHARRCNDRGAGAGGSVRPHVRRAHWHRFWTGPRDGERRLVVRWLPPIFVNPDGGEMVPTAHVVDGGHARLGRRASAVPAGARGGGSSAAR